MKVCLKFNDEHNRYLKQIATFKNKLTGVYDTNNTNEAYRFHKSVLKVLFPKLKASFIIVPESDLISQI